MCGDFPVNSVLWSKTRPFENSAYLAGNPNQSQYRHNFLSLRRSTAFSAVAIVRGVVRFIFPHALDFEGELWRTIVQSFPLVRMLLIRIRGGKVCERGWLTAEVEVLLR
jgi:hypothetical protein